MANYSKTTCDSKYEKCDYCGRKIELGEKCYRKSGLGNMLLSSKRYCCEKCAKEALG